MLNFLRLSRDRMIQSRAPIFGGAMDDPSVRTQLFELFRGKCSFCEQRRSGLRSYRFRPSSNAQPPAADAQLAHVYYSWLADAWQNLYLICEDCLPKDSEYFPVEKARAPFPAGLDATQAYVDGNEWPPGYPPRESALLLDPCRDKTLGQHLGFGPDGRAAAKTPRGAQTIETFRLNRKALLRRRKDDFTSRLKMLNDMMGSEAKREPNPWLFDFGLPEFVGAWTLLLQTLSENITPAGRVPRGPERLGAFFARMRKRKNAQNVLARALKQLAEDSKRRAATGTPPVPPHAPEEKPTATLLSARVRNFKAVEDLTLTMPLVTAPGGASAVATPNTDQPVPSLLILGENAAGKSSILEALALALVDDAMRNRLNVDPKRNILDPTYMGALKEAAVREATIDVSFDDKSVRTLTIHDKGFRGKGNGNLPPVFAYGAFRHFIDGNSERRPETAVITIFKPEQVLANPEEWLLGLDEHGFQEVVRALRFILSIEGDFEMLERDQKNRRCLIVQKADDKGKFVKYPLRSVSSGYRAVLAMTCDVFRGLMETKRGSGNVSLASARAIVLIDEVESHLHPRWKMQIMRGLRQALPNVTFIATTHDPLCLRGMRDGEVRVLQRVAADNPNGGTLPVMVEALTILPDVSKLTIEQLLTSDLFSLFSTDKPELEIELARIADILAKDQSKLEAAELAAVQKFNAEIVDALPVGNTEVHRLVQDAVAAYLKERRLATAAKLEGLKRQAKDQILAALREA
jgi:hypothetical protein